MVLGRDLQSLAPGPLVRHIHILGLVWLAQLLALVQPGKALGMVHSVMVLGQTRKTLGPWSRTPLLGRSRLGQGRKRICPLA